MSKLGPAKRRYRPAQPARRALSPRQRTIVIMIADGYTNRQIAEILSLSVKTVESHRASAMARSGSSSIAHLVRYAVRVGLVED